MNDSASSQSDDGALPTGTLLSSLATWTDARLPLPEIVRGLADEYGGRARRGLEHVAERLEAGDDLPEAVTASQSFFRGRLRRQLAQAATHGQLRTALPALAAQEASLQQVTRQVIATLLYPALVLMMVAALALAGSWVMVAPFREMFDEFELSLPALTEFVLTAAEYTPWVIAGLSLAAVVIVLLCLAPTTRRLVHWLATAVPVLGPLWVAVGHHALAQQLAAYLAANTPVADALRNLSTGLPDGNLARAVRQVAAACDRGESLADAMAGSLHIERMMVSVVRGGEHRQALPVALAEAAGLYQQQIDNLLAFIQKLIAPCLLVLVGGALFLVIMGLMLPLISGIKYLT